MKARTYAHFLWHALRLRWNSGHKAPLTMNLQVTYRCRHHCRYCLYDRDRPERMTLQALHDILGEAWMIGSRRVNLTGGEPLLRDDFPEIVNTAKQLGFFISVATCGTNAHRQVEGLQECDRVMLSLDGPRDVREVLCGAQSTREAEDAVALFRRHEIPFWTTTVLTRISIPHIRWIVEHAKANKTLANFVLLHTQDGDGVRFHPRGEDVEDLLPHDEEVRAALRQLIKLKRSGEPVGSSLSYLEELLRWPDYRAICSSKPSSLYRCLASRASCELTADGSLYSCGWMRDAVEGLSVFDQGFAEAFRRLPPVENCRSCASSCWLESNLLFNLNPRTVLNWTRNLL